MSKRYAAPKLRSFLLAEREQRKRERGKHIHIQIASKNIHELKIYNRPL